MTDKERLSWLGIALWPETGIRLTYTGATGCRCMSCWVYRIEWEDAADKPCFVEAETLREAIDAAMAAIGREI